MSQPSTELDFDAPEFADTLDSTFDEFQAPIPTGPPASRYRKPAFTIYTFMLLLSFLCLLAGMIVMFIEAGRYT